jgi:hypothetical protein
MSNKPEGLTEHQKELFEKLTKLQKGVATNTLAGMEPDVAHKEAGGKCNNEEQRRKLGNEILSNPAVKLFIDSVRKPIEQEKASDAIATFNQKKEMLWDVAERCAQYRAVTNAKGEQVYIEHPENSTQISAAYTFDAKGVVSAISELNKMDGDHAAQRVDLGASEDLVAVLLAARNRTS